MLARWDVGACATPNAADALGVAQVEVDGTFDELQVQLVHLERGPMLGALAPAYTKCRSRPERTRVVGRLFSCRLRRGLAAYL